MKAHLLKTTDFSQELYDEILAFLGQFNSPIQFVRAETVSKYELKNKFLFQDAYNHCISYRLGKELPLTDVVVILTSNREFDDWFSHYDLEGNICVVTHKISDGVKYIQEKYFCSYEIVCNILQNIMKLDINNPVHRKLYIHYTPEACMNDFCNTKSQIRLKFRTAKICPICYDYSLKIGVKTTLISQIYAIAGRIVTEITTPHELDVNELSNIVFDKKKHSIYLKDNGTELGLKNLQKAIYVYFIMHPEGIWLQEFRNKDYDFYLIYKYLNKKANRALSDGSLEKTTKNLGIGDTLSKKISEININIRKLISEPLANSYCIVLDGFRYKINLPKEKIEVVQ
jgi:hypothetical protein